MCDENFYVKVALDGAIKYVEFNNTVNTVPQFLQIGALDKLGKGGGGN